MRWRRSKSRDQDAIELYGLRIASTVRAHEICDQNVAMLAGQLILQRALYIRNTSRFKLSWEYCLLDPMDMVTLSDANLGLPKRRCASPKSRRMKTAFCTVTAEEFVLGVGDGAALSRPRR